MTQRVVALIQGRMSSSRLPGKILADIGGQPMLRRVYNRTIRARLLHDVLLATTTDASDDPVAAYCQTNGIPFTRGSLYDVLDRYYQAARKTMAEIVVRITADCPLIDPGLIDDVVMVLSHDDGEGDAASLDFAANRLPPPWRRTYPIGLDVEACTFAALERAWREAQEPHQREHVMPYLYEGVRLAPIAHGQTSHCAPFTFNIEEGLSERGFRVAVLYHPSDYGAYRWTVDTRKDLTFVRQVYAHFGGQEDFSWKDILDLVQRQPQLQAINAKVRHKTLKDVDNRARR